MRQLLSRNNTILLAFVLVKYVLQYTAVDQVYELHRDEYLHIDQGAHLAWGYLSVPPFTAWISYLIILLGKTEFWVKFFPATFGALTIVVVWKTIEALKGGLPALLIGASAITFSVLLRLNLLYQPNSFDVLAWTTLYYCLVRYMGNEHRKWLFWGALIFGIGFLNKYNIVFQIAGLLPALLLSRYRKIFIKKEFFIACVIALIIILPNLIWQMNNNFPVIHHMKELSRTQLQNVDRADFLKEQLLFFAGSIFVIIACFIGFWRHPPFFRYRIFLLSFFFTLAIFTFLRAKSYYAIGLYPILIAFGSAYLNELTNHFRARWIPYLAISVILLMSIPVFRFAMPIQSPSAIAADGTAYENLGLLRWEDGKNHKLPQDFADMIGWKELAAKVDSVYQEINDPTHTLVLCDNYGQAGAINFYTTNPQLHAVTFHADYIDWISLETEIRNIVLVQNPDDDDPERKKEIPLFVTVKRTGRIENPLAREYGTSIYALVKARVSINNILMKEREEKRWK